MSELPTGTVTFLFTDIEGSTRLLQGLGERWQTTLEEHNGLVRAAIREAGGIDLRTEGDAFFAVFRSAPAAVSAAPRPPPTSPQRWPSCCATTTRGCGHAPRWRPRRSGAPS